MISIIFITLIAVSAVSAADNSTDAVMVDDCDEVQTIVEDSQSEEIQAVDDADEPLAQDDDIELDVKVNDTPYDKDINVEISVANANSSKNYNDTKVSLTVDGTEIGNTTLDKAGKGLFVIPAGKYNVGDYYIRATTGSLDKYVNGTLFKILKAVPVVNVENVTVKAGEIVTIPFNVTDSKGRGISGDVIITIYWQEDSISKYVKITDGTAKASFNLSDLIGIFGGNGTFDISSLFNSTNGTFDIGSLFNSTNGTFDFGSLFGGNSTFSLGNGSFDIGSFFNGTNNLTVGNSTFDVSSFLNGTFSLGNTSFDIGGIFNGTTPISIGNTTIDFSSLFNKTNTKSTGEQPLTAVETPDEVVAGESTFDFGSLFGGNSTLKIGNSTFDISSLLNGTFTVGNSSFDIGSLLNGTNNISIGNSTLDLGGLFNSTGSFNISDLLSSLLGSKADNTFAYLFTPGTYNITVTYLESRNYVEAANDTAKLIVTPSNVTFPIPTELISSAMTTTAVNTGVDGKIGKYFTITLKDVLGDYVVNKTIRIGLNGKEYNLTTDENGTAKLQINIAKAGTYTASVCFLGDNIYTGSFKVVKITVNKQKPKLTSSKKTYKAKAKTKKFTATLKSANGKAIKGKKITFKVKGKTYSAKTNKKGVATVKVKLTKKGKYTVTVKFAGDDTYKAVSKKVKLVLK